MDIVRRGVVHGGVYTSFPIRMLVTFSSGRNRGVCIV